MVVRARAQAGLGVPSTARVAQARTSNFGTERRFGSLGAKRSVIVIMSLLRTSFPGGERGFALDPAAHTIGDQLAQHHGPLADLDDAPVILAEIIVGLNPVDGAARIAY